MKKKNWYLVHTGQYAFVTNMKMCDPNVVAIPISAEVAAKIMLLEKTTNTKDIRLSTDEEEGV